MNLNWQRDLTRRVLLRSVALGGVVAASFGTVLRSVAYADADAKIWPTDAFKQKSEANVFKALFQGKTAEASDKVNLDAPDIAENGAVVPITVSSSIPGVTTISVLVTENPFTLAASYKLGEGALPSVSSRLKMAKTTNVVAIVEAGGKLYSAKKEVKVTVGGCGG